MTDPLLETLEKLSDAASQALPYLEKYDYRKETDTLTEDNLPLDVLPKPLKEILDSLLICCIPLLNHDGNLPANRLLNGKNILRSIENLNISGDKTSISQIQFISLAPIRDAADKLEEIGLNTQASLLSNAYKFGQTLRQYRCGTVQQISPVFILPEDEIPEDKKTQSHNYSDFCSIFKPGAFSSSQKRALYDSFRELLSDESQTKPHLVILAAILLLRNQRSFGRPLTGTLNHVRTVVFKSLGRPENTAKAYKETSLNKNASPSLHKYKGTAEALLQLALGNTR